MTADGRPATGAGRKDGALTSDLCSAPPVSGRSSFFFPSPVSGRPSFLRYFELWVIDRHIVFDLDVLPSRSEMAIVQVRHDSCERQLHAVHIGIVLEIRLLWIESQSCRGQHSSP